MICDRMRRERDAAVRTVGDTAQGSTGGMWECLTQRRQDRKGEGEQNGSHDTVGNLLWGNYGQPRLYTGPNNRHKGTWLFPLTASKIAVFLSESTIAEDRVELTLLDPSKIMAK